MSLFYNKIVVHHLEVMKALHGIQFTARIGCIILGNQSILQFFYICYVHVHINQTIMQNTYHASHKDMIGIRELSPLLRRMITCWNTKSCFPYIQYSKSETDLDLPSLEVHTGKLVRPPCISKTSHSKINRLPIIRFLDC